MSEKIEKKLQEEFSDIRDEIVEAPRYSCMLAGAYAAVTATLGGVPILHSGGGCGFGQWYSLGQGAGIAGPVGRFGACAAPCSSLLEEHVVFGGEEKLRNLLESSIELLNGELFVVIPGCIPSLIGDDVDAIVDEFRDQVPIVNLNTAGFKGNSYGGYEAYFEAIIDQLLPETSSEKDDNLVNIFGVVPAQDVFWRGDLQEIKNLFEKIGIHANIFFGEENCVESLKEISSAKLNIVLSPWIGHNIAEKLKEKYDTDYVVFPSVPIGARETTSLLEQVADLLEIPEEKLNAVIEREERRAYTTYEYVADSIFLLLPNAYFAVAADSGTAIGITKYLTSEVGYIPDLVIITDNPPEEYHETIINHLNDLECDLKPEIVFEKDSHKIRNLLKDRKFQYLLASSLERFLAEKEFQSPHLSVSFPIYDRVVIDRSYVGFRGGFVLLEDMLGKVSGPV